MTPELYNRISNELREFLNREPTKSEVMNAQNDYMVMHKVEKRINDEEKFVMQEQIDSLTTEVAQLTTTVDSVNVKSMQ